MYRPSWIIVADAEFLSRPNQRVKELFRDYCKAMRCSRLYRFEKENLRHVIIGQQDTLDRMCWNYGKAKDPSRSEEWRNMMAKIDDGPWVVLGLMDPRMAPVAKKMPELFSGKTVECDSSQKVRIGIYGYRYVKLDGDSTKVRGEDLFNNVIFLANEDDVCYAVNIKDRMVARLPKEDWLKIKGDALGEAGATIFYESVFYSVEFIAYNTFVTRPMIERTSAIQLMDAFIIDGMLLD